MTAKRLISIHWFRQDLRLSDNPALSEAIESGDILPIYILDDINSNDNKMGEASRWWLHHSLSNLNKKLGGKISFYNGDPKEIFNKLSEQYDVKSIYWNRCYEPWRIKRDKDLKKDLEEKNIHIETHNGSLLWEPWTVLKNDGTPYRVFSPYYKRGCLEAPAPREPIKEPSLSNIVSNLFDSLSLDDLDLLPKVGWYEDMENLWSPGEDGAKEKLHKFLDYGLLGYKEGRNFPLERMYLNFRRICILVKYPLIKFGMALN